MKTKANSFKKINKISKPFMKEKQREDPNYQY